MLANVNYLDATRLLFPGSELQDARTLMKSIITIRPSQNSHGISDEMISLLCLPQDYIDTLPLKPVMTKYHKEQIMQLESEAETHPENVELARKLGEIYRSFEISGHAESGPIAMVTPWRLIIAHILRDECDTAIEAIDAFEQQSLSSMEFKRHFEDQNAIRQALTRVEEKLAGCPDDLYTLGSLSYLCSLLPDDAKRIATMRRAVGVALSHAKASAAEYAGLIPVKRIAVLKVGNECALEMGNRTRIQEVIAENARAVMNMLSLDPTKMPSEVVPTCSTIVAFDRETVETYEQAVSSSPRTVVELTALREIYRSISHDRQYLCWVRLIRAHLLRNDKTAALAESEAFLGMWLVETELHFQDLIKGRQMRAIARLEKMLKTQPNDLAALDALKFHRSLQRDGRQKEAALQEAIVYLQHAHVLAQQIVDTPVGEMPW